MGFELELMLFSGKPLEREKVERTLEQARAGISADAYSAAWKEGLSAPLDRALGLEAEPGAECPGQHAQE